MSLHEIRFWGASIQQCASMMVVLPSSPRPFPVLYLLHGLSDDHTGWQRRTSIERYVESHHVAVVMPACRGAGIATTSGMAAGPHQRTSLRTERPWQ